MRLFTDTCYTVYHFLSHNAQVPNAVSDLGTSELKQLQKNLCAVTGIKGKKNTEVITSKGSV